MACLQLMAELKHIATFILAVVSLISIFQLTWLFATAPRSKKCPISVNYHFSRRCNKECGFRFHTAKTSYRLQEDEAKRGLALLKQGGMKKINFAGGEPFLYPQLLGVMAQFCKEILKLESVSIVSNGSLIHEKWLARYGRYVDILAVSCDSFNEQTNKAIGRGTGDSVRMLFKISDWCKKHGIKFKLNTVVCRMNFAEDMVPVVEQLQPFRWKCFQVLMVEGENDSEKTLRDVRRFQISDEEYQGFCDKHQHLACFVPEPNRLMAKSYLILDEYMRFLDRDGREPSGSILKVGVQKALQQVYWDEKSFVERGGIFEWTADKKDDDGCGEDRGKGELEW